MRPNRGGLANIAIDIGVVFRYNTMCIAITIRYSKIIRAKRGVCLVKGQ